MAKHFIGNEETVGSNPAKSLNCKGVVTLKRLKKSKDKKIFGVCGGVASFLEVDPTIVRLLWAGSVIFFGVGGIAYLIAAMILPSED